MIKILKNSYLYLVFLILLLLNEPLNRMFYIEQHTYTPVKCALLEDDYNKLLEFNNIDYIYDGNYINSKIIFKDIYNYLDEILIRGGKDVGLNNNMVIYDNTLIGVISKVKESTSTVKLLTNKDSKISVKINDEIGILEVRDNQLVVTGISNYSNINKNDNIYTSGMGYTKENIYIGTVKDIVIDKKGIQKTIKVRYDIDIKNIDYVTVIKESR